MRPHPVPTRRESARGALVPVLVCFALLLPNMATSLPPAAGSRGSSTDARAIPLAGDDTTKVPIPVCTAPGDQFSAQIISDGSQGAIVVWQDQRDGNTDIYAHHLLGAGLKDPGWPWNGTAVCRAAGAQTNPRLVSDGLGGAIVTWEDNRADSAAVYAQHLLASGVVDPTWPANGRAVCTVAGGQHSPAIDSDGASGALIAWEDWRSGVESGVYLQHVLGSGVVDPTWPAEGVTVWSPDGSENQPAVVSDLEGGAIVVFTVTGSSYPFSVAQHIRSDGHRDAAWPTEGVGSLAGTNLWGAWSTTAVPDGTGGAIIVGVYESIPPLFVIYAQDVLASSTIAWRAYVGDIPWHNMLEGLAVAPNDRGGAVVAYVKGYDDFSEIRHADLLVNSCPTGASFPPFTSGMYSDPAVVTDDAGGLIVACSRTDGANRPSLRVQHVLASSQLDPMCPPDGKWIAGAVGGIRMLADGLGGVHLVWQQRDIDTGSNIYATRLVGPYPTPVLIALVSADATVDHVRLTWSCEGSAGLSATVYRCSAATAWQSLGSVSADGMGRLQYDDAAVTAGERYGYRLGIRNGDREDVAGETWVEVPTAPVFALSGARPNPAVDGKLWAYFALPTAAPATLELFDVSGRRIRSLDVGTLGAGIHTMDLDAGVPLSPGMYLLRLTQGAHSLAARAIVVR